MIYLAVDPGKRASGWALLDSDRPRSDSVLMAGLARGASPPAVRDEIEATTSRVARAPTTLVVVECPQVYRLGRSVGDPNDLIDVALVAGACTTLAPRCVLVRPRVWKGTIDGDVHVARTLRDPACAGLSVMLAGVPASLRHNAVDAVALGLWARERYAR